MRRVVHLCLALPLVAGLLAADLAAQGPLEGPCCVTVDAAPRDVAPACCTGHQHPPLSQAGAGDFCRCMAQPGVLPGPVATMPPPSPHAAHDTATWRAPKHQSAGRDVPTPPPLLRLYTQTIPLRL